MESPDPQSTVWQVGERFRGWRLDRFLAEHIPQLSRTRIQAMIPKRIRVSWLGADAKVQPSTKVHVGGEIIAGYERLNETAADLTFTILYEDEDLLAVDKPRGVLVHPTNRHRVNTLIEAIRRERKEPGLTLTHRLDRDTSGVLLLARNAAAARACGKAFMAHQIQKTYLARVHGRPIDAEGTIDQPIGKAQESRVVVRRAVVPDGEKAITLYKVLETDGRTSLLELRPVTGRRHQLRVHLEWLGCPIVGDMLYGQPDDVYLDLVEGRRKGDLLQLHAWKLIGVIDGRTISIESPSILATVS